MEAPILAALVVLGIMLAIRRRWRDLRNSLTNQPAAAGHEPLIRQNHQDWKDAVYNPKEHRRPRPPCG